MFICVIWFFSLGCEYGDRASGCYTRICPVNPSICCGTCYSGPTLTKPTQKPTTKYNNPCKTTVMTNKGATNCIIRSRGTMLFISCISLCTYLFICETRKANWGRLWIVFMTFCSLWHIVAVLKLSCPTDYFRIL